MMDIVVNDDDMVILCVARLGWESTRVWRLRWESYEGVKAEVGDYAGVKREDGIDDHIISKILARMMIIITII